MLARCNSDMPPRDEGFGGKVTTDGSRLVTVFPGQTVPDRLQLSPEELAQREIAKMVNQGEEASLACLTSILKTADDSMNACEAAMAADAERAAKAVAEMDERGPESHRPGIRSTSRRRRRRKQSGKAGSDAADDDASDLDSVTSSTEGEDDIEADGSSGAKQRHLPSPVVQGSEEHFRRLSEEELAPDEIVYDEYGELIPPPIGATSDRMHRIIKVDADAPASEAAAEAAALDLAEHPWPAVSRADVIRLMRRAQFFRGAELQEELLPVVADWFELQQFEAGRLIAEEGTWCHSLILLFDGTLEARGRVFKTPGAAPRFSRSSTKDLGASIGKSAGRDALEGLSAEAANSEGDETLSQLPQPQLVGAYDTLAPILLHPGACFGEAALAGPPAGPRLPHTCSVRTLERSTLLALRRPTLAQELQLLPVTARQAWEQESLRQQKLFSLVAARWRHHNLRRLRIFKGLEPKQLHALEKLVDYRLIPAHTCVHRVDECVSHLLIVLDGQVGEFDLPEPTSELLSQLQQLTALSSPSPTTGLADEEEEEGEEGKERGEEVERPSSKLPAGYAGHDVTSCRPGLVHASTGEAVDGAAAGGAYEPPMRRRVTDASDVPFVGEAPLLLPTSAQAAAGLPSETILMTLTQCQVVAIPYKELAKRHNLFAEMRKRVVDTRSQPSALITLLQTPPATQRKLALAAALTGRQGGIAAAARGIAAAIAMSKPFAPSAPGAAPQAGSRNMANLALAAAVAKDREGAPTVSQVAVS